MSRISLLAAEPCAYMGRMGSACLCLVAISLSWASPISHHHFGIDIRLLEIVIVQSYGAERRCLCQGGVPGVGQASIMSMPGRSARGLGTGLHHVHVSV
jgi:hypothetical protein